MDKRGRRSTLKRTQREVQDKWTRYTAARGCSGASQQRDLHEPLRFASQTCPARPHEAARRRTRSRYRSCHPNRWCSTLPRYRRCSRNPPAGARTQSRCRAAVACQTQRHPLDFDCLRLPQAAYTPRNAHSGASAPMTHRTTATTASHVRPTCMARSSAEPSMSLERPITAVRHGLNQYSTTTRTTCGQHRNPLAKGTPQHSRAE